MLPLLINRPFAKKQYSDNEKNHLLYTCADIVIEF
jgi:hypothetical protein